MGEYADEIIDRWIGDCCWGFNPHRSRRKPLVKSCRSCGAGNLRWQNVKGGGWALHEVDGSLHACKLKNAFKSL